MEHFSLCFNPYLYGQNPYYAENKGRTGRMVDIVAVWM